VVKAVNTLVVWHGYPTPAVEGRTPGQATEGVMVQHGSHEHTGAHPASARRGEPGGKQEGAQQSKLLPYLAAERVLRAVVLIGIGLILLTHMHADWVDIARRLAERTGLDPSRNETGKVITRLGGFGSQQAVRDGVIAVGYGLLEAVEGYGLLRRRPWGEYLTVSSTALLFIPEIQELVKRPTDLKIVGLALNIIIVVYLIIRLLRRRKPH